MSRPASATCLRLHYMQASLHLRALGNAATGYTCGHSETPTRALEKALRALHTPPRALQYDRRAHRVRTPPQHSRHRRQHLRRRRKHSSQCSDEHSNTAHAFCGCASSVAAASPNSQPPIVFGAQHRHSASAHSFQSGEIAIVLMALARRLAIGLGAWDLLPLRDVGRRRDEEQRRPNHTAGVLALPTRSRMSCSDFATEAGRYAPWL